MFILWNSDNVGTLTNCAGTSTTLEQRQIALEQRHMHLNSDMSLFKCTLSLFKREPDVMFKVNVDDFPVAVREQKRATHWVKSYLKNKK